MKASALLLCVCVTVSLANVALAKSPCTLPLASKKSDALRIFNGLSDGVETREKRIKYVTEIRDMGDKWDVSETLRGTHYSVRQLTGAPGQKIETVEVLPRDGGFAMSIDKCTATISDATFQW